MKKYYYTIWKYNTLKGGDADLLEEPVFYLKHNAFRRARKLAKKLIYGTGDVILVRRVRFGDEYCLEWSFE